MKPYEYISCDGCAERMGNAAASYCDECEAEIARLKDGNVSGKAYEVLNVAYQKECHATARLRAEVAVWKAKFADLHIAHGAIEQSLKQQDAEVEQLRRERDEAKVEAERLRVIARDTDPALRKRIESLEAGIRQSRLVWETQIKGVEGQRDAAKAETEKAIRLLQEAFSAMLDAGLDNSYTVVSDEIRRFLRGVP
jgi:chromosome segregation ATPase